eukprot:358274-Prorocentrum_minimum.AAC.1
MEQELITALTDVALARVPLRDMSTWAGQQVFQKVFSHLSQPTPKERRILWEVLDSRVVADPETWRLVDAVALSLSLSRLSHAERRGSPLRRWYASDQLIFTDPPRAGAGAPSRSTANPRRV